MKLNVNKWKEFVIGDLFDVELSKGDLKIDDCEKGDIPLVSSGQTNNGIIGYISKDGDGKAVMFSGGKITVDMFCSAFYQPDTFYSVSHGRINILTPKFDYSEKMLLFIATLINKEAFKYSYGRAVYSNEIQRMTISLPIEYESDDVTPKKDFSKGFHKDGYIPDFQWMEDYIKQLHSKPITTNVGGGKNHIQLDVTRWKEFTVGELFKIEQTKGKDSTMLIEGNEIPYIGAKHDENGLMMMCKKDGFEDWISDGNCIVFIQLGAGSAGYVNYMSENFIGMNGKTSCGYLDEMTPEIGIFLSTLLCLERPKYSFGRSWTGDRLKNTVIKLPIVYLEDGKTPKIDTTNKYSQKGYIPDFDFMTNYIKQLPFSDKIPEQNLTTHTHTHTHNIEIIYIAHIENNRFWIETKTRLKVENWKEFDIGRLFEIKNGKKYPSDVREHGILPLVSTSAENNGVSDYIAYRPDNVYENFLTVAYSGSVGATFYHKTPVFVGETVFALLPKFDMNSKNAMFLTTIFNHENYRYSYGRKIIGSKYGDTKLKLPIKYHNGIPVVGNKKYSDDGYTPDFEFMEYYISNLMYSDRI